jgi:lipoprotein-anchoring transpeptidase ErfK/SrfK
MNSLKTLFIIAVLGAVAYGVYVSINRNSETPGALDNAPAWPEAPQVQIPGPGAATPQFPPGGSGVEMAPRFSSGQASVPSGDQMAADTAMAGRGSMPAPPYGSLGSSAPAIGTPPHGTPGAYPFASGAGGSGDTAAGGIAPRAGNVTAAPGDAETLGLAANSLRGTQSPTSDPVAGRVAQARAEDKFAALMEAIQAKLDEGHLAEAHLALSSLYENPEVPPEQVQKVTNLLDQLAGTVIYSRQPLMGPPYRVRPGETLEQIAAAYHVPWQLLAKINGIRDPQHLEPGRELKVVRGPFNALIDLDKYELTLMVGGCYAGRFPIGVGRDHANLEGSYVVRDKIVHPARYGRTGTPGAGAAGDDSLGDYWIDLGNQIGIHGTSDPQNLHHTGGPGCVCLGDRDIEDLFGILSVGSRVIIQR